MLKLKKEMLARSHGNFCIRLRSLDFILKEVSIERQVT